jgi:hypothetical protein
MKRKLAIALLFLTLAGGFVSADDTFDPNKPHCPGSTQTTFLQQIELVWDGFISILF